jgi:hypothetical protein
MPFLRSDFKKIWFQACLRPWSYIHLGRSIPSILAIPSSPQKHVLLLLLMMEGADKVTLEENVLLVKGLALGGEGQVRVLSF